MGDGIPLVAFSVFKLEGVAPPVPPLALSRELLAREPIPAEDVLFIVASETANPGAPPIEAARRVALVDSPRLGKYAAIRRREPDGTELLLCMAEAELEVYVAGRGAAYLASVQVVDYAAHVARRRATMA